MSTPIEKTGELGDRPGRPSLQVVREQLEQAVVAAKCHGCGCLHKTVEALEQTPAGQGVLADVLGQARLAFRPRKYDCLGCAVCYPAIAANSFADAFPALSDGMDLCPTEAQEERKGWPPLPGDYHLVRYRAPVAVCTLNSEELARRIADRAPGSVAIVGTLHTENLGIERIIRNTLANPYLRILLLCGEDTQQAIGHLPGQSLQSLFAEGTDDQGRIRGAKGKRPVIKNVNAADLAVFRQQIELISLIGETREDQILGAIGRCDLAPRLAERPSQAEPPAPVIEASLPRRLIPDPAGFFVVYPDADRGRLVVEHFTNQGVLANVIEGRDPAAIYTEVIARQLMSRLDHAAYLGRELARAQASMETGQRYVQDRAPGELDPRRPTADGCGCAADRGAAP